MDNSFGQAYAKKQKTLKTVIAVACAVIVALGCFCAGFFIREATLPQEVKSLKWVLDTIEDNYYFSDGFDREQAKNLSLSAVASKLDRYSEYFTKEEYETELKDNAGVKSGIGISYNFVEGSGVRIVTVAGNSPARHAGITAGDIFTGGAYKGKTTRFSSAEDVSGFFACPADGEEFSLTDGVNTFTLAKSEYTASYTCLATGDTYWDFVAFGDGALGAVESRDKAISYLPDDCAYIRLSQFYGSASRELGILFEKFNSYGKKSLILDLRNNGGGYVDVMRDIAGYFTSSVSQQTCVAMTAEYKNGYRQNWHTKAHTALSAISKDVKIYVLANSGTASASEALIGVLVSYGFLDYKNIFVSDFSDEYLAFAGENAKTAQTYGKGIMQSTFVNPDTKEALKLTTARILWPNGKCIHDVALTEKDGCTPVPAEWTSTKDDGELKEVLKIIEER